MARLTVSVALLFFFFAFLSPSVARIQISKPKYDVIVRQLTNPLPRSDVKASLRLPTHSNKLKIHPLEPRRPELEVRSDQKTRPVQKLQDSNAQKARPFEKLQDSIVQKARLIQKLQDSIAQARPIQKLQDSNTQKVRSFEKLQDSIAQKARPIEKLQDSNAQKARPIEKLPNPNAQKAQPVNRRAESAEKKTIKPIVRLPFLALPDLIAVKNQSELPIEKNNEESKVFEDLDLLMKAQPESNEEENSKTKPIEDQPQPEVEEAQPETKPAAVEALPLKEVNFRLRSRLPYRLCRHSHLHHIEENLPIPSRSSQAEIPYSNDMIYTFGENGDFDPEVFSGSFNHIPPKTFPLLNQHNVNVEEVSKHLPKTAEEKKVVSKPSPKTAEERVSYFLVENDSERIENDLSSGTVRHRVLPKTIPFLHRNGPRNLRRQDAIQKVSNHRVPENNHGKDSNHRVTTEINNRGGSVSHMPRKWISFLHQNDLNKEKKPEKKESNLRKRIRKFLGQYLD
nr:hypothetical protein LOTGIDRAFT_132229 [Ipomoea trifida]